MKSLNETVRRGTSPWSNSTTPPYDTNSASVAGIENGRPLANVNVLNTKKQPM